MNTGSPTPLATLPLALFLLLSSSLEVMAQERRPLEVDDMFSIERVGSPVISGDGDWIAYAVGETSLEEEKSETRIWMVAAEGGDAVPMTAAGGSVGSPQWSPDGKYLSFTASREDSTNQVWVLDRRGGEARQLTEVEQGVGSYRWSPDGSRLLLSVRDPDPEDTWSKDKENAPKAPWVIDRLQFKRDGTGYLTGNRHTHLYTFDIETKGLTQITSGDHGESQAVWSPDGRYVAFVSNRTAEPDGNSNSDIWVVAADNTDMGQTLLQVTTNAGSDSSPAWSPDSEWITYVTVVEPELIWYAPSHLAVISSDGGEPTLLTREMDRRVGTPRFTEDGKGIIFRLEDSAENHLAWISVDGSKVERMIEGPLSVGSFDVGPDGMIATVLATLDRPNEIYVGTGDDLERVTKTNDEFLDGIELAEVKNV
jgi:dipeptidyl aminopeptidase/acylaminoacyl peptidase